MIFLSICDVGGGIQTVVGHHPLKSVIMYLNTRMYGVGIIIKILHTEKRKTGLCYTTDHDYAYVGTVSAEHMCKGDWNRLVTQTERH